MNFTAPHHHPPHAAGRMKRNEPSVGWTLLGLAFACVVLAAQCVAFSRCKERGGYYAFRDAQCVVIPGAQVTP